MVNDVVFHGVKKLPCLYFTTCKTFLFGQTFGGSFSRHFFHPSIEAFEFVGNLRFGEFAPIFFVFVRVFDFQSSRELHGRERDAMDKLRPKSHGFGRIVKVQVFFGHLVEYRKRIFLRAFPGGGELFQKGFQLFFGTGCTKNGDRNKASQKRLKNGFTADFHLDVAEDLMNKCNCTDFYRKK